MTYEIRDSGDRKEFDSGMVRDTAEGKTEFHRVLEGPMLERWAEHLTKGALKYPDRPNRQANWTLASGDEECARFRASAFRHFIQWMRGDVDEDHAAAVFFNINGVEYVRGQAIVPWEITGTPVDGGVKDPEFRDYAPVEDDPLWGHEHGGEG